MEHFGVAIIGLARPLAGKKQVIALNKKRQPAGRDQLCAGQRGAIRRCADSSKVSRWPATRALRRKEATEENLPGKSADTATTPPGNNA
ncbi:hypothetical protein APQ02_17175 [Salmonella enterica]|nr:hypothetical protein [Salmonella enterica]ECV2373686.1 hypothetical protein [Salmonella enterica subsp. enterica serovar Tennessee]EDC9098357.1 hypothetical protein [Salmonella enterica subsp. enterica serovar Senftenberg]EDD5694576.1 hypothetical protein [Salmonella enterica subsp. enterica serovar Infantis]EDR0468731.1 hypothetical protein [Salmonella enterica subsp. enterica serovar Gallinarum]EDX1739960.1 hypothetical protein [Salmonella enterica subsp. enterica serovar Worthington]EEB